MKLKILELIEYFHADQTANNNTPFSSEDYEEAIAELEKLVDERNKFANMGMAAPTKEKSEDEIVRSKGLILENVHEVEFWEKAYLSVFNSNFGNPPQAIADMAVCELRKRLEESDE